MGGELCFVDFAGDCGGDDGGGVFVPDVVLNDENGTDTALFAADHRRQIGIIKFSAFNVHIKHLSRKKKTPLVHYM